MFPLLDCFCSSSKPGILFVWYLVACRYRGVLASKWTTKPLNFRLLPVTWEHLCLSSLLFFLVRAHSRLHWNDVFATCVYLASICKPVWPSIASLRKQDRISKLALTCVSVWPGPTHLWRFAFCYRAEDENVLVSFKRQWVAHVRGVWPVIGKLFVIFARSIWSRFVWQKIVIQSSDSSTFSNSSQKCFFTINKILIHLEWIKINPFPRKFLVILTGEWINVFRF